MPLPYGPWSIEKAELGGSDITASFRDCVLEIRDDNGFGIHGQRKCIDAGNLLYTDE